MANQQPLVELFLSLFSADELRRWIRYLPDGDALSRELPGSNASAAHLAAEAVQVLHRHGSLDDADLWARLVAERPRRQTDIDRARSQMGQAAAPAAADQGAKQSAPVTRLKVLMVSASPETETRLRVDREFRDVITRMKSTRHRDQFEFIELQAARFEDLRSALLEHLPHILHISSHGEPDGSLVFEGDAPERPRKVTQTQLLRLLGTLRDNLRLVVLNACDSHSVAGGIPPTVDLAIGMGDAVADEVAIEFAVGFYEGLGFGRTVEEAFTLGIAGLEEIDDGIPRLFPLPDKDAGGKRKTRLVKV